jgi:hypothetical protein
MKITLIAVVGKQANIPSLRTSKSASAAVGMTPRRSDLKVSHYKHEETAKSGRVERGGECTYNRSTPALLRGITGTYEGKAMDE